MKYVSGTTSGYRRVKGSLSGRGKDGFFFEDPNAFTAELTLNLTAVPTDG